MSDHPHDTATFLVGNEEAVLDEVLTERWRQHQKWGVQTHPDGTGDPADIGEAHWYRNAYDRMASAGAVTWRATLIEEVYEAFAEKDPVLLRKELLQVAAVATAWVRDLDTRTL